jgi:hypothetical protein
MTTDIPSSTVLTFSDGSTSTVTYSWAVTTLKTKKEGTNTNSVIHAQWTLTATDQHGNEGSFRGATPFTSIGSPNDFIQFDELEEENVLSWVKDIVVGHYAEHIQEQIFKALDDKVNASTEPAMPWASTATVTPPPV